MTVFEQTISVLPEHCDDLGHVNNVQYLHWAEDLAWAHSKALGLGLARYQALDCAMVAREHVLTYLAACFAGDVLCLRTWFSQNDGLRLRREYRFVRLADGKTVFQGLTDWVCVQLSTGRPKRMPVEFQAAYAVTDKEAT